MSSQIQITGETKVKSLTGVLVGTTGVVSSLNIDGSLGIPQLDVNGKILVSQLPNSVMEYKGTWDASTNTPTLVNGTGNQGDVYLCSVAGTVNFGAGAISFVVSDQVIYSGSIWQKASGTNGTVTSVGLSTNAGAITIGSSPITTSGTITANFNGTNLQYVNGAGNLTTFPILTGYVPYTGATQDVDLGAFKLNAQSLHIKGTGGLGHLGLKHQSASATASANEVSLFADSLGDLSWLNGNLYLSKFITSGNTAARSYTFPNATGTVALVGGAGVGTVTSVAALTIGTSGTDLSSTVATSTTTPVITLNVPTASATNRGALSSADWSTFNSKQGTITLTTTGTSGAATFSSNTLNIPQYQAVLTNPVTGTGTTNYLPKFTGASTIGNSNLINDASGNLGLGVTPSAWGSNSKPLQMADGSVWGISSLTGYVSVGGNYYYDGNYRYIKTSNATDYYQYNGEHAWRNAPSGTAGAVITFTQAMTLFSTGNLSIANITDSGYKLDVNGTGRFSGALSGTSASFSSSLTATAFIPSGATVPTNGMYLSAANTLNFATNTTNRLSIGSTGAATFSSSVNSSYNVVTGGLSAFTSSTGGLYTYYSTGGVIGSYADNSGTASPLDLFSGGTRGLRVFTSGRIGVNTTTDAGYQLDVNGTGRFSGALTGTSSTWSGLMTINNNTRGLVLNRDAVTNYNGIGFQTANVQKWFVGMRENLSSNNLIFYSEVGTDVLTLNQSTGATTFSANVQIGSATSASGLSQLTVGNLLGYAALKLSIDATKYSWIAGGQYNVDNGFEITPSTAVGGSTFTTPVFKITQAGLATFSGNVQTGDQILIGSSATVNGAINFIKTNGSPVASRITFGTDGTGYKFAIAKNVSSTITDLFTLQDNGNVLIGTADDGGRLVSYTTTAATQIKAAGTAPAITFSNTVLSPTIGGVLGVCTAASQFFTGTASSDMVLANQFSAGDLIFGTNNLARMRIKASGVINITSIPTSSVGLVSGDVYSSAGVLMIV